MCLKDLKSKNKKRGGFALVINITTKRHNFPKYAVKRRQTPSKAFWCLCPWLWIRGVRCQNGGCWGCPSLLPAHGVSDPPTGAAPAGSSTPGSSTCCKHPAHSGLSEADRRAQLTCFLVSRKINDPEVLV